MDIFNILREFEQSISAMPIQYIEYPKTPIEYLPLPATPIETTYRILHDTQPYDTQTDPGKILIESLLN